METPTQSPAELLLPLEKLAELNDYIDSLQDKEGMLIHVLHRAQHIFGYLPKELQLYIARRVGIPAAKVYGVVSFYSYFTQTRRGEHTVSVCMGTACFVKGAEEVKEALKKELKVTFGETTEDDLFSMKEIRCIGACGLAPAIMVDEKVYGHMNEENVRTVINSYRGEGK
ncbi:NAD(P)H-dependent oxidoreductase subunit E [Proteiniclasticum sp. BAD-10]|uniref:NAD(P)H-dependent oxidoreductase subunit E n=1 Tax=Proteiniclasticum sediminis TaxID=2804028 RepID=A0A941CMS5_9CLOT|nr:NAD(P)H-dependent oxidoreductase subunit E [Proteiniclasticum sediminis]MBR0575551.1 NAD(P)H-dependent oxidoreductase subunit E [Proteiniclasticum sediminis]